MFCGSYFWMIFPLMLIGMMILCFIFSGRRGRWFCCFPSDYRHKYRDRIRELEDEIERLKGK